MKESCRYTVYQLPCFCGFFPKTVNFRGVFLTQGGSDISSVENRLINLRKHKQTRHIPSKKNQQEDKRTVIISEPDVLCIRYRDIKKRTGSEEKGLQFTAILLK
jgi:hypothetical protein